MSLFGYIIIIQGGVNMSDKQHYLSPNFMGKIFERTNLQRICNYIMYGGETKIFHQSYSERLENGCIDIHTLLHSAFPASEEFEDALGDLSVALDAYIGVYSEIGMQIGARLVLQLINGEFVSSSDEKTEYHFNQLNSIG